MNASSGQADLFEHSMPKVSLGARVRLSDGRTGFVRRLSPKGVVELVSVAGAFVCISHVECVRVVISAEIAARVPARSASEDGRASGDAAAEGAPLGIYGENAVTLSKKGRA